MNITLFGIKNCDTVKKAQKWLDSKAIEYCFRDFREAPLSQEELNHWINAVGLDTLVNKRSTSYRQLTDQQKAASSSEQWRDYILQSPTLIKRPVLLRGQNIHCGFKAAEYEEFFSEQ